MSSLLVGSESLSGLLVTLVCPRRDRVTLERAGLCSEPPPSAQVGAARSWHLRGGQASSQEEAVRGMLGVW